MKTISEPRAGYFHSVTVPVKDFDPWLVPTLGRNGTSLILFQITEGQCFYLLFYRRQNNGDHLDWEHGFASWQLPLFRRDT